jgi:hypothetical protein
MSEIPPRPSLRLWRAEVASRLFGPDESLHAASERRAAQARTPEILWILRAVPQE